VESGESLSMSGSASLAACPAYSSILNLETVCSSEMWAHVYRLQGVTSHETVLLNVDL
jgi:hypothetical protein